MPIRAIIIMFVVAVALAVCYRDEIYKWFTENVTKPHEEEEKQEDETEEEKEDQD